jgi:hypothetical protein
MQLSNISAMLCIIDSRVAQRLEVKDQRYYSRGQIERKAQGGAIAEFGPALMIIFLVGVFPLLDLLGLALKYADCYFLYNAVAREAGIATVIHQNPNVTPPAITSVDLSASTTPTGSVKAVIKTWQQSGLGAFANVTSTPTQVCTVDNTEGTVTARFVHVALTATCSPFLSLPLPVNIPGLTRPVTFNFNGRTTVENLRDY